MRTFKLALITGGSSGIGLALAKKLVAGGTDICLLARNKSKLKAAQTELVQLMVREAQFVDTLSLDVTDFQAVNEALNTWTKERGLPDLLINSAGVVFPGYFQELDMDTFYWLMDVNYFGTLHIIKSLVNGMIQRKSGTIVNISSQAGLIGVFGYSGYSPSKYAVRGLTDVLRSELKPLGINLHLVFPPDTQTPQLAFEEPLKPKETSALAGNTGVLSAERVASEILRGVNKGKYVILPGFEGKLLYRLISILGNQIYPIIDLLIKNSQKGESR